MKQKHEIIFFLIFALILVLPLLAGADDNSIDEGHKIRENLQGKWDGKLATITVHGNELMFYDKYFRPPNPYRGIHRPLSDYETGDSREFEIVEGKIIFYTRKHEHKWIFRFKEKNVLLGYRDDKPDVFWHLYRVTD